MLQLIKKAVRKFIKLDDTFTSYTGKALQYLRVKSTEDGLESAATSTIIPTVIKDANADTKVDVEESANEDKIRMDVKGVEAFLLNDDGILDLAKQSRVRSYRAVSNQTISYDTYTKIQLNAENYDNQNEFDSTTNYRFTATKAGYYQVNAIINWSTNVDTKRYAAMIYKNGGGVDSAWNHAPGGLGMCVVVSDIIYLAAGDYLELYTYHDATADQTVVSGSDGTYMAIHKLS